MVFGCASVVLISLLLTVINVLTTNTYKTHFRPHNPEVAGSNPVPAIDINLVKPVTYGWLFSCAKVKILDLGLRGACLGVPVLSVKMAPARDET